MQDTMHLRAAIMKASDNPDLNEAVELVQKALGVQTGDIAGLFFADTYHDEDAWKRLDADRRSLLLLDYVRTEMTWLLSYNEFDEEAAAA